MSMSESFTLDSDLQRDAVIAAVWVKLCCELRAGDEGETLPEYMDALTQKRGDNSRLLAYLMDDLDFVQTACDQLRAIEATSLGSTVVLDDVARFMPHAYRDTDSGGWIYTASETEEAELLAPTEILRVRRGADAGVEANEGSRTEDPTAWLGDPIASHSTAGGTIYINVPPAARKSVVFSITDARSPYAEDASPPTDQNAFVEVDLEGALNLQRALNAAIAQMQEHDD